MAETQATAGRYTRDESEFDRALAFVDATFAFAMTLLVTTLDIDDPAAAFTSVDALTDTVGAQFVTFFIAFAVIAGYWLMSHRMVASFVAIDTPTIIAHIFMLAGIVLIPFSTAAVGDPDVAELPLPTAIMALNVVLISVLFTLIWVLANRNGLLGQAASGAEVRQTVTMSLLPAAVFLASIPIAYAASPDLARLFWISLAVLNPIVGNLMAPERER
jgi:uncharacterized membrane protein